MSLLMNEDFAIYQLRLGYLNQIRDGVGERLINLNPAVLNNPAFRAAGWICDTAAIKRCYSPPIPTGGGPEISNEYFQRPRRPTGRIPEEEDAGDGGGMVTGNQGSEDTLGPVGLHANERKRERRRRKEQSEEDDSSDLSDDSDEDELAKGPAQSIKFSKMPVRSRAQSSPPTQASTLKAGFEDGPAVMITSPSRPPASNALGRLRSGSSGQVEALKQRARRDTTTSSEISSENEVAPFAFKRKMPSRPGKGPSVLAAEDNIEEEENEGQGTVNSDLEDDYEDFGDASDLSDDDFDGTIDSNSILGLPGASDGLVIISPPKPSRVALHPTSSGPDTSPKKQPKDALPKLQRLPPGERPKSIAPQSISMISMMIKGNGGIVSDKPFQKFADLLGRDEPNPLWIKIYAPFSTKPTKALEVPVRRIKDDRPVTVAELIGLALWRYVEDDCKPELTQEEGNVNWWSLRIVEDEEIDYDFPALVRTRPVVDFTSNNNRPPARRARDKPWDEFGLVKATPEQFKDNENTTPQIAEPGSTEPVALPPPRLEPSKVLSPVPVSRTTSEAPPTPSVGFNPARNPIIGPSFAPNALRKDSSALLDAPQREGRQGAARIGAPRTILVTFTDPQSFITRNESYDTTADSYIAEIFEKSCARFGLDKALYVLKVHGTQTVAPLDRTIEALGDKLHLDLLRRRFAATGMAGGDAMFGLGLMSNSPGSSSPNAPLDLTPANATPDKSRKKGMKAAFTLHPLAAQQQQQPQQKSELTTTSTLALALDRDGKRYNVLRKQPLSFAAPRPRTLIITPEYMTIMPAAPGSLAAPSGKVTNVPMTSLIGAKVSRKHPKMVRILVLGEKEKKGYDFEAVNHREAEGIVADVRRGMAAFGPAPATAGDE